MRVGNECPPLACEARNVLDRRCTRRSLSDDTYEQMSQKVWIRVHPNNRWVGKIIGGDGGETVKAGDYLVDKVLHTNFHGNQECWYETGDDCPVFFRLFEPGIEELNSSPKDLPATVNEDIW